MNILYLHRTQGKGVEGVHIYEIVRALCKLGNNVTVVSPIGVEEFNKGKVVSDLVAFYAKASVGESREYRDRKKSIYGIISKYLPEICFELVEILYNVAAYKNISKILKEKKYDFIYERYAIFNWAGVKAAKKNNIPILVEINYTSFTPLYRKRSALLKPLAHLIDKMMFRKINRFVVVSTYLENHLVELKVPAEKIIVLTNAADPEKFSPNISGDKIREKYNIKDKIVIGFSGGFYPWHGLGLLIEVFIDLKKDYKNIALMLIGDGPLKRRLEKKVSDYNIAKNVIFTGKVDHEKLPKYIAAFDVAVMPDSNDYGSPMKVFEYMAMGKPVVAPKLGPLEDGIRHRKTGFLFGQQNKKELIKVLVGLINNEKLCEKIGIAAQKNILHNHTWQKNGEKMIELYRGINTK